MGRRLLASACLLLSTLACALRTEALADAGDRPWSFSVDVAGSFDDNRDGTSSNKESNLALRTYPRVDYKLYGDHTDLDFFYSPQIIMRTNPRESVWCCNQNAIDLYHDLGVDVVHRWSERLSLAGTEAFNLSDTPADMGIDRTYHEFVTYWVNRANVAATYEIIPVRSLVTLSANHSMKKYEEEAYASVGDETTMGGGVTARYMLKSGWLVAVDVAYSSTELGDCPTMHRNSDVFFAGGLVERVFGLWFARLKFGVDMGSSEVAGTLAGVGSYFWSGTTTEPGGDLEIAYNTESGMTRIDLTTSYHTIRSDIAPFAAQQRTSLQLHASHSFSDRIQLSMDGVYAVGEYDVPYTEGGSDAVAGIWSTLTYVWNRNLSLNATYRFEDWNADDNLRESYRRNTVEMGLKAKF